MPKLDLSHKACLSKVSVQGEHSSRCDEEETLMQKAVTAGHILPVMHSGLYCLVLVSQLNYCKCEVLI